MLRSILIMSLSAGLVMTGKADDKRTNQGNAKQSFSGIYPHLTHRNYDPEHASECSVAAIVPWAGKLWTITYPAHMRRGSVDKLRSIDSNLNVTEYEGSVGGTHANRFIHKESNQLIIGLHFIDAKGNIRSIDPKVMPGRHTAIARHLTDPKNKVYFYEMEGALYEVDVHTLKVKRLFEKAVQGWHGKGACSGQGRLIIANNGESSAGKFKTSPYQVKDVPASPDRAGALAEWDGKKKWKLLHRIQHCEVTGPGGIYGNASDDDPIWVTGFDRRSILLRCLDNGKWHTYRLPKGSYTHDGKHGWHTEWPRIREIDPSFMLMHMHGLLWDFPKTFTAANSAGLKPIASYHKMMVDYCKWNDKIAMACNDTTVFGNPLVTQAQSNIRFIGRDDMAQWGPRAGFGGPCLNDNMAADQASVPYLLAGFKNRVLFLSHRSKAERTFVVELDNKGTGEWKSHETCKVAPGQTAVVSFPSDLDAEWLRVVAKAATEGVTAYCIYSDDRAGSKGSIFAGVAPIDHGGAVSGGIIRPLGDDMRSLHCIAKVRTKDGKIEEHKLEVTTDLKFKAFDNAKKDAWFRKKGAVDQLDFEVDAASVIIRDEKGNAFRLPKSNKSYDGAFDIGCPRGKREVVTERSLWNCHGSFYEVPRDNSGGVQKMQPICTHNRMITDYCSWQGMLVLTGVDGDTSNTGHLIRSKEFGVGLWLGDVDDLWKFGKPTGTGGPWHETSVKAGKPSDPYIMLGYDKKTVSLSHDSGEAVTFTLEIDPSATGTWSGYKEITCPAGKAVEYVFPDGFSPHWIRVKAGSDCRATCTFVYR